MIAQCRMQTYLGMTQDFLGYMPEVVLDLDHPFLSDTNESLEEYVDRGFRTFLESKFEKVLSSFVADKITVSTLMDWRTLFFDYLVHTPEVTINRQNAMTLGAHDLSDRAYFSTAIGEFVHEYLNPLNGIVKADTPANDGLSSAELSDVVVGVQLQTHLTHSAYSHLSDREVAGSAFNGPAAERAPFIAELFSRGLTGPGISKEDTFSFLTAREVVYAGHDIALPISEGVRRSTLIIDSQTQQSPLEVTVTTMPAADGENHEVTVELSGASGLLDTKNITIPTHEEFYIKATQINSSDGGVTVLDDDADEKIAINTRQASIAIGLLAVDIHVGVRGIRISADVEGDPVFNMQGNFASGVIHADGESATVYEFTRNRP